MKKILIVSILTVLLLASIASAGILQEGKAWQSKAGIRSGQATGNAVVGDFFKRAQPTAPATPQVAPKVKVFDAQSCDELVVQNNALLQLIAKKLGVSSSEILIGTANAVSKIKRIPTQTSTAPTSIAPTGVAPTRKIVQTVSVLRLTPAQQTIVASTNPQVFRGMSTTEIVAYFDNLGAPFADFATQGLCNPIYLCGPPLNTAQCRPCGS